VDAVNVSATLFPMIGMSAAIGRTYTAEEELAGSKLAVLSDSLWRGTFGGDPNAIGRSIFLDNKGYRIIGVMPAEFEFPIYVRSRCSSRGMLPSGSSRTRRHSVSRW
jgi:hypothetical protein